MSDAARENMPGGIIHTYQKYDPQRFPMPSAQPPDIVTPAFEHLLTYGSLREFTEAELAEAIRIDPSQIRGLGPSIAALIAMLEERKQKILAAFEIESVRKLAARVWTESSSGTQAPSPTLQKALDSAIRDEQIRDIERIWYRTDEQSTFARRLLRLIEDLGNKYQIDELAARYTFTGRQALTVDQAIEVKEQLETIDRLIEQLKQAARDAKLYLIDMDALAEFAEEGQLDELEELSQQVSDILREMAEQQGLHREGNRFSLTPRAFKLFQTKLLEQIFSQLQAARTGRHAVEIGGDGAVELQRTRPYEFGDSLANMDVVGSTINALVRRGPGLPIRLEPRDLQIHVTRNTPKCATVVCMDMSGSMRWGMQYVNVKRMALALHGLIRREYPGDFVDFVEIATLPRRRHVSEIPELLPRPVTTHDPIVRLKADMSDCRLNEWNIHPHFTNIQQGLRLGRQMLQVQDTPNRQIILITDGLPTAHFEENWLYMLYPPDPRTEYFTLREGLHCNQLGITINIFLLSSWSQSREDVQFAHRLAESTRGRVFFVAGRELDRFVVWDYVRRRRSIVG